MRAERFARILASAKLAGRCDALVTNLRSFAQRFDGAEGSRKVRIPLKLEYPKEGLCVEWLGKTVSL